MLSKRARQRLESGLRKAQRQEQQKLLGVGAFRGRPQALDVYQLLLHFLARLSQGHPPSLATFKQTWQDLHFSHIFEGAVPGFTRERYVQLLFTTVLECLAHSLPSSAGSQLEGAWHARHRRPPAAAAAGAAAAEGQAGPLPPLAAQQAQQQVLQPGGGAAAGHPAHLPTAAVALECGPSGVAPPGSGNAGSPGPGLLATLPDAESHLDLLAAGFGTELPGSSAGLATAPAGALSAEALQLQPAEAAPPSAAAAATPPAQLGRQQQPQPLPPPLPPREAGAEPLLDPLGALGMHSPLAAELEAFSPLSPTWHTSAALLPSAVALVPADDGFGAEGGGPLAQHPQGPGAGLGAAEMEIDAALGTAPGLGLQGMPEGLRPLPPGSLAPVPGGTAALGPEAALPALPALTPVPLQPRLQQHVGALSYGEEEGEEEEDHEAWLEQLASHAEEGPPAATAAAAAASVAAEAAVIEAAAAVVGAAAVALLHPEGAPVPKAPAPGNGGLPLLHPQQHQQQQQQQPAAAAAGSPPAALPGPPITQQAVEELLLRYGGVELRGAALLALYCLYCAQPGAPAVKIYLSEEHQAALLEALPRLQERGFGDAVAVARQLLAWGALVVGSTRAVAHLSATTPGGGLQREEAALMREVKFHLTSTLRGLGTSSLGALCSDYEDKLGRVWAAVGGGAPPESIADLSLGRLVHEYVDAKHDEVQAVLRRGRKQLAATRAAAAAAASAAAAAESGGGAAARAAAAAATDVTAAATEGRLARRESRSKKALPRARNPSAGPGASGAAAGAEVAGGSDEEGGEEGGDCPAGAAGALGLVGGDGGDDGLSFLRLPRAARRALQRQQARKREVQRRYEGWRQHLGAAASAPAALALPGDAGAGGGEDAEDAEMDAIDHDMPALEGLEWGLASEAPPAPQRNFAPAAAPRPRAVATPAAPAAPSPAAQPSQQRSGASAGTEATVEGRARPAAAAKGAGRAQGAAKGGRAEAGPKASGSADRGKGKASQAGPNGAAAAKEAGARTAPKPKAQAKRKSNTASAADKGDKGDKRARAGKGAAGPSTTAGKGTAAATAAAARGSKLPGRPKAPAAPATASASAAAAAATALPSAAPAACDGTMPAGAGAVADLSSLALLQQAALVAQLAMQALAEDEDYDAEGGPAVPAVPAPAAATSALAVPAQPSAGGSLPPPPAQGAAPWEHSPPARPPAGWGRGREAEGEPTLQRQQPAARQAWPASRQRPRQGQRQQQRERAGKSAARETAAQGQGSAGQPVVGSKGAQGSAPDGSSGAPVGPSEAAAPEVDVCQWAAQLAEIEAAAAAAEAALAEDADV